VANRGARRGIKAQSGFTLVELIVVIVVMGLISLSAAAILRDSSELRIPD
jgi:prepilin-type N-terminal cleavage/methylation domain-containing protein